MFVASRWGPTLISANTTIDSKFDAYFQNHIRSSSTDTFVHNIKWLGDGSKTVPIIVGVTLLTGLTDWIPCDDAAQDWGMRSLRAYAVGLPPMLAFQEIIGSDRPGSEPLWFALGTLPHASRGERRCLHGQRPLRHGGHDV